MKNFLLQIFVWWHGQTIGTRFFTWRVGRCVGKDQFGNTYYEGGKTSYGLSRRWVIYNGYTDPSSIPPVWHGWIHHRRIDKPSKQEQQNVFDWQKPHRVNLTGSPEAYCPRFRKNVVDEKEENQLPLEYKAWSPSD
ncbi:MAG: NADH:ubiquinone oxidoreductase subunit NDUFA12 [Candidatus Liberibacter ctenarytainae]|uniref:NADH:ubiquinone oxidoreductase subunit NDUFA12 n=1 Tax=Candidatus Liberibacter ctenarytainae TaxID=2020335 RepID=A0A937DJA2_9HYPH|nr:NADH:ubiquinone oxidoreductase subunit NDUFA12 [Candidatus Liberibacter ctenarytainae]